MRSTGSRFLWGAGFVLLLGAFGFWWAVWYGPPLDADAIDQALSSESRITLMQQTLVDLAERMSRGSGKARRWYPRMVELSRHTSPDLRQTVAMAMGRDRKEASFRDALAAMLSDPDVMVQRTAAKSLAAHGDVRARSVLEGIGKPVVLTSPSAGTVEYRARPGDEVKPPFVVARVGMKDITTPVPGNVSRYLQKEGGTVVEGDAVIEIAPDAREAAEAIEALARIK